jgi:very-short-patch-repair endonuclease
MLAADPVQVNLLVGFPFWIFYSIIPLSLLILGCRFVFDRSQSGTQRFGEEVPFRGKDFFFTRSEQTFYKVLIAAIDSKTTVFSKVRMEDVLWLPKGTANRQKWSNRVRQKHLDFVLCDNTQFKPFLVIELDGDSHDDAIQQSRDADKDAVLEAAGIPLQRIQVATSYSARELQKLFAQARSRVFRAS